MDRSSSAPALLARLGFAEPRRAAGLLAEPILGSVIGEDPEAVTDLAEAMADVADPDLAAMGLVRLVEALATRGMPSAELASRLTR